MQEVSEKYNNDSYRERHALSVERLRTLPFEESVEDSYIAYFRLVALFLLEVENVRIQVESGKWDQYNEEDMRQINEILYSDIVGDAYEKSYANPKYACSWFEPEMGRLLSFLYVEMRSGIPYAFEGRLDYLTILYELFIEVYTYFENCRADGAEPEIRRVRDIVYWYASDYCDVFLADRIKEQIDPSYSFAADIIENADLSSDRYLYRFGEYITENELGTARRLRSLPEETIQKMADVYTEGYRIGFINTGKDLSKKSVVNIRYSLGFERVIRAAIANFRAMGLKPVIYRAASGVITKREHHKIGYFGAVANWQYEYDHRQDQALFMDKRYIERRLEVSLIAFSYVSTASSYSPLSAYFSAVFIDSLYALAPACIRNITIPIIAPAKRSRPQTISRIRLFFFPFSPTAPSPLFLVLPRRFVNAPILFFTSVYLSFTRYLFRYLQVDLFTF